MGEETYVESLEEQKEDRGLKTFYSLRWGLVTGLALNEIFMFVLFACGFSEPIKG